MGFKTQTWHSGGTAFVDRDRFRRPCTNTGYQYRPQSGGLRAGRLLRGGCGMRGGVFAPRSMRVSALRLQRWVRWRWLHVLAGSSESDGEPDGESDGIADSGSDDNADGITDGQSDGRRALPRG